MRRVFKTRYFDRWQHKTDLTDRVLCLAVDEMERGLIDADLGGGLVKKRIALPGRGKSGGARTLLATNRRDRWFFLYGFEKNERDHISEKEFRALQDYAKDRLGHSEDQIRAAILDRSILEICHE